MNDKQYQCVDSGADIDARRVEFWLGGGRRFVHRVSVSAIEACYRLPKDADRWAYWRGVTGDKRIVGHVLIWSTVR